MVQLMLFAVLLLLPFNITPTFVVWCYGKFLLFLDPVFSVIEVVQVVLVIMYSSKSFINEIDEQPVKIKVLRITPIQCWLILLSVFAYWLRSHISLRALPITCYRRKQGNAKSVSIRILWSMMLKDHFKSIFDHDFHNKNIMNN